MSTYQGSGRLHHSTGWEMNNPSARIEYTGNIQVHHPEREDHANIDAHTRAVVNRLVQDQNNPEGDL